MFRKDSITIKEWIENTDKALLVTGARQTGKTWLIRDEIDKSGFKRFEINFIDQPDMIDYLNAEMSVGDFLVRLKMIMPEECRQYETVVFFDEIQKCPEIVTKIRFLVDEGSFKYAMSGSLLGVELKGIIHIPTGVAVTCTDERSRYMNKQKAIKRLQALLSVRARQAADKQTNQAWREHNRIVRGYPVRTYEGEGFKLKKNK